MARGRAAGRRATSRLLRTCSPNALFCSVRSVNTQPCAVRGGRRRRCTARVGAVVIICGGREAMFGDGRQSGEPRPRNNNAAVQRGSRALQRRTNMPPRGIPDFEDEVRCMLFAVAPRLPAPKLTNTNCDALTAAQPENEQPWNWGRISREEAIKELTGKAEGTFIVRMSTTDEETYSISVVQEGQVGPRDAHRPLTAAGAPHPRAGRREGVQHQQGRQAVQDHRRPHQGEAGREDQEPVGEWCVLRACSCSAVWATRLLKRPCC